MPLEPGDVVVASGGARGVTAATLIELARQARPYLVLLGRTPLAEEPAACRGVEGDAALKRALLDAARAAGQRVTPAALGGQVRGILSGREIRATLAAIEAAGGGARYVAVDVTDRAALGAALVAVRAEIGPVRGVVHGAGVLADKFIADKTDDQFDRVFDTKVEGLRALLDATAGDPLKVIAPFSSVAARSGNQGQCDYAMANEILNKVAAAEAARRGPGCVARSIGWGPWEGGMVTPALKARFESMGVPLIPLDVGARMFVDELRAGAADVEVVIGGAPRDAALLDDRQPRALDLGLRVDAESHPWLASHRIKGVPVVPAVVALEWFVRAARAARPDLHLVACRDLRVLRGIKLSRFDDGGDRLTVRCRRVPSEAGVTLALELRGEGDVLHYSATAEMAGRPAAPGAPAPPLEGLAAWGEEVYGGVLFHGPDFQVIRRMGGLDERGVTAQLAGTREQGWAGQGWRTDVAAMDGGLQMALLWAERVLGGASLPTAIGAFQPYTDAPPEGPIHATLTRRSASGARAVSDITFTDERGVPIAELKGVETHLLPS